VLNGPGENGLADEFRVNGVFVCVSVCAPIRICPLISSTGSRGNMNAPEQEEYLETNSKMFVRICGFL